MAYATTLAYYLHLAYLPADKRPDFTTHPIMNRLMELKQAVSSMEDADFDAASVDENDVIELYDGEEDSDEDPDMDDVEDVDEEEPVSEEVMRRRMLARALAGQDSSEEEGDDTVFTGELEDGELDDLQADAGEDMSDEDDEQDDEDLEHFDEDDLDDLDEDDSDLDLNTLTKKPRKEKSSVLEEPEFVPASKTKPSSSSKQVSAFDTSDDMGDLTALSALEQAERSAKKRSLQFHTSKIAATSARRAAARQARLQGDEDVPYRNMQAARDAALQRNSARSAQRAGQELDGQDWDEGDKKRAREAMGEEGGEAYYDAVKRRRTQDKEAKQVAHDLAREEERYVAFWTRTFWYELFHSLLMACPFFVSLQTGTH